MGCLLAAGLTAHAAGSGNNGTVFGNIVYSPLDLKLKIQYNDSKGRVHEATITSKDILQLLGYPKGDQLATDYDGFANLSSEEIFGIDFNYLVNKKEKDNKSGSFSDSEKGVVSLNFDFIAPTPTGIVAHGSSQVPPSEVSFEANGVYLWQSSGGAIKNGDQKIATSLTANSFVGDGFGTESTPAIKANAAISGSGDFLIKDGTSDGNGGGTVTVEL